jgi:23S rRNA (cytosine1962-C5)-methyltransferase
MIRPMTAEGRSSDVREVRLIDAGDGRRLEQFGSRVVDRPASAAVSRRLDGWAWRSADLRYEPGEGWRFGPGVDAEPWPVEVGGLTMELRPTASGGLGLYPEHARNIPWLEACIARRVEAAAGTAPLVLNLFAHTGLATLALARAGAHVAHLDAARSAVAWARRNAELSGLADRPIRWLVDDALAFVAREGRRGHRYDGLVLDPPSFGRARRGARASNAGWSLREDLDELLRACGAIVAPDAFVLVTAHTAGLDPEELATSVEAAFPQPDRPRAATATTPLELTATSGARLNLGWAVRLDPLDAAP